MITEIGLTNFKKHSSWSAKISAPLVLIHGSNAIGKTSVLEAISLFSPGTGIFGSDLDDLIKQNTEIAKGVIGFEVAVNAGFKLNYAYFDSKKEIRINSTLAKSLNLLEYIRIYGLNPYISLAFWKDSEIRRKHIDRLVMQNNLAYASLWAKYSKTLKERSRLIAADLFNSQWAAALDPVLIETGLQIAQIREDVLHKLIANLDPEITEFLGADLQITMFPNLVEQKEIFAKRLEHSFLGPHRTKFELGTKLYSHSTASTAEQKKMLLAITLAALPKDSDTENVLLLDDVFMTLDQQTVAKLIQILSKQDFQTFITHTQDLNLEKVTYSLAIQKLAIE